METSPNHLAVYLASAGDAASLQDSLARAGILSRAVHGFGVLVPKRGNRCFTRSQVEEVVAEWMKGRGLTAAQAAAPDALWIGLTGPLNGGSPSASTI
jgi:hypothetical protein